MATEDGPCPFWALEAVSAFHFDSYLAAVQAEEEVEVWAGGEPEGVCCCLVGRLQMEVWVEVDDEQRPQQLVTCSLLFNRVASILKVAQ